MPRHAPVSGAVLDDRDNLSGDVRVNILQLAQAPLGLLHAIEQIAHQQEGFGLVVE